MDGSTYELRYIALGHYLKLVRKISVLFIGRAILCSPSKNKQRDAMKRLILNITLLLFMALGSMNAVAHGSTVKAMN